MEKTWNNLVLALGWAITHSYFHFTFLVKEGNQITTNWFLLELVIAILASSQLPKIEKALKFWIISIALSIIITMGLMVSPTLTGAMVPRFTSLIITGAVQPLTTVLLLSTPLHLLGCFIGQVVRNRLT